MHPNSLSGNSHKSNTGMSSFQLMDRGKWINCCKLCNLQYKFSFFPLFYNHTAFDDRCKLTQILRLLPNEPKLNLWQMFQMNATNRLNFQLPNVNWVLWNILNKHRTIRCWSSRSFWMQCFKCTRQKPKTPQDATSAVYTFCWHCIFYMYIRIHGVCVRVLIKAFVCSTILI